MFNRELDYYGISSAADRISHQESLAKTLKDRLLKAKREHDMYLLAVECYNQVCQDASLLTVVNFSVRIPNKNKLYNQMDLDSEERRLFDKYLEGYFGLKIVNLTKARADLYTTIVLAFTTNVIVE